MGAFRDDTQASVAEAGTPRADTIYQSILDAIYQGRLIPGSVVNEAALAHEFGVSRGPVREAVRRLQGIQLVTREPYLKARVVTLDAATAVELFELRMALDLNPSFELTRYRYLTFALNSFASNAQGPNKSNSLIDGEFCGLKRFGKPAP